MASSEEECFSPRRRVPLQLQRLPAEHLRKLVAALEELEGGGLRDIQDIEALKRALASKADMGNALLPASEFTTTAMEMSLWAWTPSRWKASLEGLGLPVKVQEPSGVGSGADQSESLKARMARRIERSRKCAFWQKHHVVFDASGQAEKGSIDRDHFDNPKDFEKAELNASQLSRWFKSMLDNQTQIDALPSMNVPQQKGDGVGVLFEFKADAGKWQPPKREPRAARPPAEARPAASVKPSVSTVHLGATGCAIGAASWNRIIASHGLAGAAGEPLSAGAGVRGDLPVHFEVTSKGAYVPRAVFARFDGAGHAGVGSLGCHPTSLIDMPGNSQSCADGAESDAVKQVKEAVRKQLEKADNLSGLFVTTSMYEDAFGAGVFSGLMKQLRDDGLQKKMLWTVASIPSKTEQDASFLKSACWSLNAMIEFTDANFMVDKDSLMQICQKQVDGLGIACPSEQDCWGLAGGILPSCTASLRLGSLVPSSLGYQSMTLGSFATNMVPYPRIKFFGATCAPLLPEAMANFDTNSNGDVARAALSGGAMADLSEAKRISTCVLHTGMEGYEVHQKVQAFKSSRELQVVDWCPTSFLCRGLPAVAAPKAEVFSFFQSGAFKGYLDAWVTSMEGAGATEGLSGEEAECLENLMALSKDYSEVCAETADCDEEEEEEY